MAALISKTLVGEKRRTWRAIGVSTIIRRFNMWAVDILRSKVDTQAEKKKIVRVRESKRVSMFAFFISNFMEHVKEAKRHTSAESIIKIYESIEQSNNKSSSKERARIAAGFARDISKAPKSYKAETESGFEKTALMGGKVELRALKKGEGHEPLVDAEITARNIPTDLREFIEEYGENVELNTVPYKDKKQYLKIHEAYRSVQKNPNLSVNDALESTNAIEPQSDELKQFLEDLV